MLEQMHNCVQNTIERFRNVPTPVIHKCFKAAEKDRAFEAEVARQMDLRNEHDQRSQKLFYKSLNPPEIIWGQPVTIAGNSVTHLQTLDNKINTIDMSLITFSENIV